MNLVHTIAFIKANVDHDIIITHDPVIDDSNKIILSVYRKGETKPIHKKEYNKEDVRPKSTRMIWLLDDVTTILNSPHRSVWARLNPCKKWCYPWLNWVYPAFFKWVVGNIDCNCCIYARFILVYGPLGLLIGLLLGFFIWG